MPATFGCGVACRSFTGRVASASIGAAIPVTSATATFVGAGSGRSGAAGPDSVHAGLDNMTTVSRQVGRMAHDLSKNGGMSRVE